MVAGVVKKATLGTLFLTVFLDLLGFGLVVPFLPRMARALGAGDFTAALIGSAYSAMQLAFVPLWGRLSDRVGRRPVLLWSIAATAVSMAGLSAATSLAALFAARAFSGAATANVAVTQAYIADVTTPEERSRGMGLLGAAFGLGFILGPFFGGQLAGVRWWGRESSAPALAAALLAAVNFLLALRSLPESLPPERRAAAAGGAAAGRGRAAGATGAAGAGGGDATAPAAGGGDATAPAAGGADATGAPGAGPDGRARPSLALPLALNLCVVTAFAGLEQTFTLYTLDAFGLGPRATGNVFGLMGLVAAIVQGGLIRRLTRAWGEVALIRGALVCQVAAFALFAVAPRYGLGALCGAVVLVACGSGALNPSVSSYVSQRAGATVQGATLGALQSTGALGRTLGPATGGALYQGAGPTAPYVASAVGMGVAWLLSWRLEALARPRAAAAVPGARGRGAGPAGEARSG
jgi:MFS family permease